MNETQPYPGGIETILDRFEARRAAFGYAAGEALPALETPLDPLAHSIVADPDGDPTEAPPFRSSYHRKRYALRRELTGQSELCALNALLIAHLRKRDWPTHAPALFQRLWSEQSETLLAQLNLRWLVSSMTTFGDHGATPIQRSVGLSLSMLFGMMKLYESERLFSGYTPTVSFDVTNKVKADLPLEMNGFALMDGGLDVNLIARLWREAENDAVIAPLAHHLLTKLIEDPGTVMRRLKILKAAKTRDPHSQRTAPSIRSTQSRPVRWGVAATIRAPLEQILDFTAWHLERGAHQLWIYLDDDGPDAESTANAPTGTQTDKNEIAAKLAVLNAHPAIRARHTDAAWWDARGGRPDQHQHRQTRNIRHAYRVAQKSVDWLAHIDCDEFLLSQRTITNQLAALPPHCLTARIRPIEALAHGTASRCGETLFKALHHDITARAAATRACFPDWADHLSGGFLSHVAGKLFVRTGIDGMQIRIHNAFLNGQKIPSQTNLTEIELAHMHATSFDQFLAAFQFRHAHGSYRAELKPMRRNSDALSMHELFSRLLDQSGEAGLRAFYDAVCTAHKPLCAELDRHGLLRRHILDLPAVRESRFPTVISHTMRTRVTA